MLTSTPQPRVFQAHLALSEGAYYVERPADRQLPTTLHAGGLCYVLAPRQIGKSSLRVRTDRLLRAEGVRTAMLDLSLHGVRGLDIDGWYLGLAVMTARGLELDLDVPRYWTESDVKSPPLKWARFLREVVVERISEPIVIFIDEIDSLLSLEFSADDFFIAIRGLYNRRAEDPALRRLTFCFLGTVSPAELMPDDARTPFNAGVAIRLEDFTRAQLDAFLPGLVQLPEPERGLDRIFHWTHGHPYMTHRLCEKLSESEEGSGDEAVDALVTETFLVAGRTSDANLAPVDAYFSRKSGRTGAFQLLQLYDRLLQGERVLADPGDSVQIGLMLVGLAAHHTEEGAALLQPRNRIVAEVFDRDWVHQKQADRFLAEPLTRWLASGRSRGFLMRGQALDEAEKWAVGHDDLTVDERDFLDVSRAKERRLYRRTTATTLVFTGLLTVSLVVLISLWIRLDRRHSAEVEHVGSELAAKSRELAEAKGSLEDLKTSAAAANKKQEEQERQLREQNTEFARRLVQAKLVEQKIALYESREEASQKQIDDLNKAMGNMSLLLQKAISEREAAVREREEAVRRFDSALRAKELPEAPMVQSARPKK